jgi:TIR domain/SIR2-like domain
MTEAHQVAFNSARSRMKDSDWWALITSIREQRLIPVIGPSVIRVPFADRSITYERYISQQLAEDPDYKLVEGDFQQLGVTFDQATLSDVVAVCARRHVRHYPYELHDKVWRIVNDPQFPIPPALTQLSKIKALDLFVTATFDPLMARALKANGSLEELVYRRSAGGETADLPKDFRRSGRRFLYYLFGKAARGREDFAICEVELLRTLVKLHDGRYKPRRLFDALRENHLLLLGVNFGDWLARFFLWLAKDRGNASSQNQELREYFDDPKVDQDRSLVVFLQQFSNSTVVVGDEPEDFVSELYRRWSIEGSGVGLTVSEGSSPKPPEEMQKGAIFLSYSRTDRVAAETLYTKLRDAGLSVWYDAGLRGGQVWEEKIHQYIENCGAFIPLVSSQTLRRSKGEFRAEWEQASDLDRRHFGTGKTSIVPVVVDDGDDILKAPHECDGLPAEFSRAQMYHCPRGEPSQSLIDALFKLVKRP